MDDSAAILSAGEAEAYIASLEFIQLKDIGGQRWLRQHEYLEKLNMQALLNARAQTDEFVMELFISLDKIPVLVENLVCIEIWKQKVLPLLYELKFAEESTITPYMTIHHEAVLMNLLETILFHRSACESAGDSLLELGDYCYRRLIELSSLWVCAISDAPDEDDGKSAKDSAEKMLKMSSEDQLKQQASKVRLDICIKAVSVLRYMSDHIETLPVSVVTRLLKTHDVIVALVPLVERPPWLRIRPGGKMFKYIDGVWTEVKGGDRLKLSKAEAQVWLALYNFMSDPECRRKYEFNSHNKGEILKLRAFFNEVLVDQLPVLGDLQRQLEQLAVVDPPLPQSSLVLEQVPEVRERILAENKGRWADIAKHQKEKIFTMSHEERVEHAKRLAATYNFDAIEKMLPTDPKCAQCGETGMKRCSRCQNEWYCGRECQVKHWSKHKDMCNLLSAANAQQAPKNGVQPTAAIKAL